MKVLLTTPVAHTRYDYIRHILTPGIKLPISSYFPSLALDSIKASLEEDNEVTLLHPKRFRDIRKRLGGVDLVGISSTTGDYADALETASRVKQVAPETRVVMGGPHVSVQDVETLETGNADVVVRGEGEGIMQKICSATPLEEIEGITYRRNGKILRNEPPRFPPDLVGLPFPKSMGSARLLGVKREFGLVVSSRGCPHRCSFCMTSSLQGHTWRARPVENMVRELEQFSQVRYLFFVDDNFTLDPQRVEALCEIVRERRFSFRWACMGRADSIVRHQNLLEKMFEAGLIALFIGVESANPASLKEARKQQTRTTVQKAFEIIHAYPIISVASIMFGFDSDTLETMDENIEFMIDLNPTAVQATVLTPFPGTEVYAQYAAEGRILTKDWSRYDLLQCVFHPRNCSPKQLENKVSECRRRFYGSSRKRRQRARGFRLMLSGRL
jgi:anaerobic magnesium-protoporphyrin IX monomethyl ester cyclase